MAFCRADSRPYAFAVETRLAASLTAPRRTRQAPSPHGMTSVRPDDASNIACSGRLGPRLFFLRFDHVEILVRRSRIEEHDLVFGVEEAAGAQLLIRNQRCGTFGRGEHAFHTGPVSQG